MTTFSPIEAIASLWYLDSTTVAYVSPEEGILPSLTPYVGFYRVKVGNGSLLPIANVGSLTIQIHHKSLTLKGILYVPKLKHNLFICVASSLR